MKLTDKIYECNSCHVKFVSKKGCKSRQPKFCSKECYGKSLEKIINCKLCGERIINKHSAKISNRIYCSIKCKSESKKGIPLNEDWKKALSIGRKKSDKCKGANLYNWKGGEETKLIRLKEYFYKRKKNLKKSIDIEYLNRLIKIQNNKCFYCEIDLTKYKAIEHLTPVSKGGDNDNFNLVYSCKSCNSKKNSKTLEQYAIENKQYHLLDKFDYIYASAIN